MPDEREPVVRAVVVDIEGTTTPIRFVHDTLFAFARARLAALVAERGGDPEIAAALDRVRVLAPDMTPLDAQRLLFGHTGAGDLTPLFAGFFDTATGSKREAGSYRAIAASLGWPPKAILFLSDLGAELDAAAAAGWRTCQLDRPADAPQRTPAHPAAADFDAVEQLFALARHAVA